MSNGQSGLCPNVLHTCTLRGHCPDTAAVERHAGTPDPDLARLILQLLLTQLSSLLDDALSELDALSLL